MTSGTTAGFRYLQFGCNTPATVTAVLDEAKRVKVNVRLDSYRGRVIATLDYDGSGKELTAKLNTGVVGKHAVYFEFLSDDQEESYSFDRFTFDR
jgi:hypothetical protein